MGTSQGTTSTVFCRGCGYELVGLSENRCPECGRGFDPADRRTFLRRPKGWVVRRWTRWIIALLLCISLPVGGTLGWLYWGWRAEQPAIAALKNVVANHWGPAWLQKMMPRRLSYLLYRVDQAQGLIGRPISPKDMAHLGTLRHVRILYLSRTPVTNAGMAHLRNLRELEHFGFWNTGIGDAGLANLAELKSLKVLSMSRTAVTDEGLQYLHSLVNLQKLSLADLRITDAGLARLSHLQALEELDLSRTRISDAGIGHLCRLRKLRTIDLDGTAITSEGVRQLRLALPGAQIKGKEE